MSLGLGQMLGMGILSQFMGGGNKEETQQNQQPTQVADRGQSQNQGFFPDLNNMSQSQWANTAIALNSMRLRPNASLASSMQSIIDNDTKKTNRNATVEALIKMGKPNLANLVSTGAMDVSTAMTLAFKESKGDVNGTQAWMETFRGKGTPEQDLLIDSYRALIASAEGDPTAIREYVKLFSNDFGVGVKDLKDTPSGVQIQQQDGMVMGVEMKEGQKFIIVTDEFGESKLNVIDGAFGESERMKYERELEQQLDTADQKLAVKYSNEAYLEASSAMDSVQKYQHVQSILMGDDGKPNPDAITGWIADFLPSFKAEQAIIKSTANIMGIDVINMATFGALSEREMAMAMQTNLDTRLSPGELYKQIVGMVESRQKLAQEMLKRAQRITELGSWEKYKAEQIVERKGHLATRYKKMPSEVQKAIMVAKYKEDTKDHPDITFETWDANNAMTGYQIWSYFNFNARARFIANMDGMTGKQFLEIMGHTEFADDWWQTNEGTM
ncbi:MAG: hypothetical protein QF535_04150 [Anaerolineales bacterium]|nr:hypothetical protein [Anaerolineales bacterium]